MRAFCLCQNRKKIAGITTNGVYWCFTNYEMMDNGQNDKFQVSKAFTVLKIKEGELGYYQIMEKESVEFFRVFDSFMKKNIDDI